MQSLVGFAWRGRATGGVIGLPFPAAAVGAADGAVAEPALVYGLAGVGSGTIGSRHLPALFAREEGAGVRVTTGDSSNAVLAAARTAAIARGGDVVLAGGAGNKILAAADGICDLAIMQ